MHRIDGFVRRSLPQAGRAPTRRGTTSFSLEKLPWLGDAVELTQELHSVIEEADGSAADHVETAVHLLVGWARREIEG